MTPWIAWKTGTRNWRSAWHLTMKSLSSTSPNMAISWVVLRTRATYARKVFCTLRLASATKGLYFERLFSKSLEIENVVYFKHFSKISQASCQGCPSCGLAEIVWVCQQSGTTRSLKVPVIWHICTTSRFPNYRSRFRHQQRIITEDVLSKNGFCKSRPYR